MKTYIHRSFIPFMFALAKSFWPSDVVCKFTYANFIDTYLNPLQFFSYFVAYWQALEKTCPKHSPLETFKYILKTPQLTTYIKALVIAFKFNLSSFKHVMIFFLKPCWSNNLVRFFASACLIISIASNKPIIKCLGYQLAPDKLIMFAKMSWSLLNIQRSKLIVID